MSKGYSLGHCEEVLGETDKAIHVHPELLDESVWIPKSCIHDDSEVWKGGQDGEVIVVMWWARRQGWCEE